MDIPALQQAIDSIDDELISLLQRRFVLSRQIGTLKKQRGQPSIDEARVISQRTRFVRHCIESGLDPTMSQQLVLVITEQVIAERLGRTVPPTQ